MWLFLWGIVITDAFITPWNKPPLSQLIKFRIWLFLLYLSKKGMGQQMVYDIISYPLVFI